MTPRQWVGQWFNSEIRRLRDQAVLDAQELQRMGRALTIAITERKDAEQERDRLQAELDQANRDLASEQALHARVRHQRDSALRQRNAAWDRLRDEYGEAMIDNEVVS